MADGSTGASDHDGAGFVLKPWELHGEGREFEKLGRELGKAVGALEKDLAVLGTPWGADRPGGAFAAVYGPARGELLGGLRALAGQLGGVGAGLHTMAERTTDTDTTTADGFGGTAGAATSSGAVATPGVVPAVPKDMSV
ncbi:hypothetical protein [Kitasatospora sp. NPDC094011]|uniref:hypothetical protein n=1 Tax=Kitasatospora sp. NPDC094011 TaxID=3364090 RepID=UPI00382E7C75